MLSEAQDQGRNSADAHLGVGSKYDFRGSWLHILRGMGKHDRESKAVVVITYALVGHTQTHVHNLSHDTHACARPDAMWLPLVGDILEAPLRPKSTLQRPGARSCRPAWMSVVSSTPSEGDRSGHGGKTCLGCGLRSTAINTKYRNKSPFASREVIPWGGGTPEKPKGTLCYCCKIVMVKAGWIDEFGSVEARSKPQNTRHYPPRACTACVRRCPCSVWRCSANC